MGKRMLVVAVMAMLVAGVAAADTATLKDHTGLGYTYSDTRDTMIDRTTSSKEYDRGLFPSIRLSSMYYVAVMGFDLSPLGPVESVNSATLRVYQTTGSGLSTVRVNQLTEDWTEGIAGDGSQSKSYNYTYGGANCYARHPGTDVPKATLTAHDHSGTTIYYLGDVTDLAVEPENGTGHYLRGYYSSSYTRLRNYDVGRRLFVEATDLDDLITKTDGSNTRNYWYDDANDRIYVRTNDYGFFYFGEGDMWADAVWDGSRTYGPLDGSIDEANTYETSTSTANWWEVDITPLATKWLVDGEDNFGMRVRGTAYNGGYIASADAPKWDTVNLVWEGDPEYVDDNGIYVQPELLVDYEPLEPVAEPGCLSLLGLTLLGLKRRKRS
jgi:hypothetical protein